MKIYVEPGNFSIFVIVNSYTLNFFRAVCFFAFMQHTLAAPTYAKTDITTSMSFDNFGDLIAGKTINAFSLAINAPDNNFPWDLYVENGVAITQLVSYTTQGVALPLSAINVRAFNLCATPDQEYPDGFPRGIPAITGTFASSFTMAGPHMIVGVGTVAGDDGVLADNEGACDGTVDINDDGTSTANPTTHYFRIDLQVTPGVAAIIQPGIYRLDISISLGNDAMGVALQTEIYSLNIEIAPILQIKMNSSQLLEFTFAELKDYNTGITKYGATSLSINSSVDWDLMAVGTSTQNESTFGVNPYWDNNISYSTLGVLNIPLDVLEIFQTPGNPAAGQSGVGLDYSPAFTNPPSGDNNIEVAYGSGVALFAVAPSTLAKTIAGNWGTTGAGNMITPGSYNVINGAWNRADFNFTIGYRLVPGLPVMFSHTAFPQMAFGTYARPGAYTMQVKYILAEDQ